METWAKNLRFASDLILTHAHLKVLTFVRLRSQTKTRTKASHRGRRQQLRRELRVHHRRTSKKDVARRFLELVPQFLGCKGQPKGNPVLLGGPLKKAQPHPLFWYGKRNQPPGDAKSMGLFLLRPSTLLVEA